MWPGALGFWDSGTLLFRVRLHMPTICLRLERLDEVGGAVHDGEAKGRDGMLDAKVSVKPYARTTE